MKEGYVARTEITIAKRASQTPSQFGSNFRTYPGTAAHAREQTESGMTAPTAPTGVGRRVISSLRFFEIEELPLRVWQLGAGGNGGILGTVTY